MAKNKPSSSFNKTHYGLNTTSSKIILIVVVVFVILLIFVAALLNKPVMAPDVLPSPTPATDAVIPDPNSNTGLANPASVNCQEQGGTLIFSTDPSGGQYGLCDFGDNMMCEEWALFRGDCPIGGVKTTGYDTPAQIYCAQTGSTVDMAADTCTKGGETCPSKDYYSGLCTL